jgi:hypothetical protein
MSTDKMHLKSKAVANRKIRDRFQPNIGGSLSLHQEKKKDGPDHLPNSTKDTKRREAYPIFADLKRKSI